MPESQRKLEWGFKMVCVEWPELEKLSAFRQKVESEIGRQLTLCDIQKHDDEQIRGNFGRYESSCATIWHRVHLEHDVKIYVIAHELGHALQEARGYPRIQLTDIMKEAFNKTIDKENKVIDKNANVFILLINRLAGYLCSLLLDPGADYIANKNGLLKEGCLEYCCQPKPDDPHIGFCVERFDAEDFRSHFEIEFYKTSTFITYFDLLMNSTRYANKWLRLNQFRLLGKYIETFKQYNHTIRSLGDDLVKILSDTDLNSSHGCKQAGFKLIDYLRIPEDKLQIVSKE